MTGVPNRSEFALLPAEEAWAAEVAARLRLVLASGADESNEDRSARLEEEVLRSLELVPQGQRPLHVAMLRKHFPSESVAKATDRPSDRKLDTPEAVIQVLSAAWANFTADQKLSFRQELVESGVVEVATAQGDGTDFSDVKQRLGLSATEQLVSQKLGKLCVQESEFLIRLDQLVWNTWKALAQRSALKRDAALGDMRLQFRRYLKGDSEPTDLQIAQQIERTRQLTAVLIGSIAQIGSGYVKRHQTRYSPEAIRDLVKMEGGGGFGFDSKCWKKYAELASEINEATIQAEMVEIVVKYVEELMKGMVKTGS